MKEMGIRFKVQNGHLRISDYFKEAFKVSKEIFRKEKMAIIAFFIVNFIPNLYVYYNLLEFIIFPAYMIDMMHYFSFTSIRHVVNADFIMSIEKNIPLMMILSTLRDVVLLLILGKCIGHIERKDGIRTRGLLTRSLILTAVYLFPMFLISFLLGFFRILPGLSGILPFGIVILIINIIFLYFIPLYISEDITLKEAFSRSLALGKGNRVRQVIALAVSMLVFLIIAFILFAIAGFVGKLIPHEVAKEDIAYFGLPLPTAIIDIIIANILRIVMAAYMISLVSVIFLDVKKNNESEG